MLCSSREFSIAQYADGSLPAEERAALEDVLRRDAEARALLEEYRSLDRVLKSAPMPELNWDRLAEQTSSAVDQAAPGVPDDIEFAIAQYADGSLPAAARPVVEARLAEDADARNLLSDYATVDSFVRTAAGPLPPVRWSGLAAHISAAVDREAQAPGLPEELEFAIAQYADGTLAQEQVGAVEAKLTSDANARLLLADYTAVASTLKQAEPLPVLNWNALAEHLSVTVAQEAEAAEERQANRYKLFAWARSPMWLAAAASVVIAVGVGIRVLRPPTRPIFNPVPATAIASIAVCCQDEWVAPGTASIMDIAIGPPPGSSRGLAQADYDDEIVTRPSRVVVASGPMLVPDGVGTGMPF